MIKYYNASASFFLEFLINFTFDNSCHYVNSGTFLVQIETN